MQGVRLTQQRTRSDMQHAAKPRLSSVNVVVLAKARTKSADSVKDTTFNTKFDDNVYHVVYRRATQYTLIVTLFEHFNVNQDRLLLEGLVRTAFS